MAFMCAISVYASCSQTHFMQHHASDQRPNHHFPTYGSRTEIQAQPAPPIATKYGVLALLYRHSPSIQPGHQTLGAKRQQGFSGPTRTPSQKTNDSMIYRLDWKCSSLPGGRAADMEAEHIEVAELQAVYLTLSREPVLASMILEDEEGSREKDYAVGNGFGDAGEGSRGCRGHITVSGQERSSHCHSVFTLRITGINVSIGNVGKGDPFSSTSTYIGQTARG